MALDLSKLLNPGADAQQIDFTDGQALVTARAKKTKKRDLGTDSFTGSTGNDSSVKGNIASAKGLLAGLTSFMVSGISASAMFNVFKCVTGLNTALVAKTQTQNAMTAAANGDNDELSSEAANVDVQVNTLLSYFQQAADFWKNIMKAEKEMYKSNAEQAKRL